MPNFKNNQGLTLAELVVSIGIGATIMLVAVSLFLLGVRFHSKNTATALRQNEIHAGISLIEQLVTENVVTGIDGNKVMSGDDKTLLYYSTAKKAIFIGENTSIMENVTEFSVEQAGALLSFAITVGEEPVYEFSVYSPMTDAASSETEDAVLLSLRREPTSEEILAEVLVDQSVSYNVRAFLSTLSSQLGSTGRIQTEAGEGEYFSQWYIGSYDENPGWDEETPWCACFVSWALEENSHLIQGKTMRFANVDAFWAEFVTEDCWKTENPKEGDLIFFDWIVDGTPNPQHVGVVLRVSGDWVYTVEGNTDGVVALRKYLVDDNRILGYGCLNWR